MRDCSCPSCFHVIAAYFNVNIIWRKLFYSACFIEPDCCVNLIQFAFGVLVSVYTLGLFSNTNLNVLLTVHLDDN